MRRLILLIVVTAGGLHYLRRSLPQTDGTITVLGLTAPIDIVRDADDIPHVFAANKSDALFGLGYVHAQDRLWQMEFQRRIAKAMPQGALTNSTQSLDAGTTPNSSRLST